MHSSLARLVCQLHACHIMLRGGGSQQGQPTQNHALGWRRGGGGGVMQGRLECANRAVCRATKLLLK